MFAKAKHVYYSKERSAQKVVVHTGVQIASTSYTTQAAAPLQDIKAKDIRDNRGWDNIDSGQDVMTRSLLPILRAAVSP